MPFRERFDCLWCGAHWETRRPDDLEGWAALCPECLGKADDNGFLRSRLRTGLSQRAAAAQPAAATSPTSAGVAAATPPSAQPPAAATPPASTASLASDRDAWYMRQGRFSRGPIMDGPWGMELDEATRWVDAVPMEGIIVELGAGTGWWSALLAGKGELWIYDADGQALDQARKRLMAHDLLAHIHERDPLAPADKRADVVFAAHLLGAASDEAGLVRRLDTVLGWLKPGATFCFLEVSQVSDGPVDGPNGLLYPRSRDTLGEALTAAGFVGIDLAATPTAFVMGRAQAPVVDSSA